MNKFNKKGYTLIEILAVVILLGILLLIAVPAINKQLNQFRIDYYTKVESSSVAAGKDYITDKRYSKPTKLLHAKVVPLETLEKEGYLSEEVKDYAGEVCDKSGTSYSYFITVKTGEKKFVYQTCLKCSADEYYTDTTKDDYNLCDPAWLTNDRIEYEDDGSLNKDEALYVYYGTTEQDIKKDVGLKYYITKKNNKGEQLARIDNGDAVYPKNINELVGLNVNSKVVLNYVFPDNTAITKDAIIYKHLAPKVTMTYVGGPKDGQTYNSGEWSQGVKVRIAFSDNDNQEVLEKIDIKKVEYFDEATNSWTKVCDDVGADYCIWTRTSNFNKTIKFRITNDRGHASDLSSAYTIKVDNSAPTCGTKVENTTWTNTSKTVSVGCVDGEGSGCVKATYSETYPTASVANKNTTNIVISDTAGNSTTCSLKVMVDTTKPSSCTVSLKDSKGTTINAGGTANYDVTFTVTGIDNKTDDSGINTSKTYATISGTKYANTASFNNGTYSVTPVCTDNAGNTLTGSAVSFTLNKTVAITYMSNGGSGTTSATTCNYNQNCTVASNNFSRTGHTFNGWNTNASGTGTNHSAGGTVKLTTPLTLYAKWKANTYTISYTLNGGTNNSSNPSSYTYGVGVAGFANPTRTGYTFNGWYLESSFTNKKTSITTTDIGNKTLYAKWSANGYTLTYNNQSGSGCSSKGGSYDSAWGDLCTPSRAGYTFGGWYTGTNGSGTNVTKSTVCKGNLTVYAKWTANNYTLTYDNQSGSGCTTKTGSYNSEWGALCTPSRTGYTFGGWYTSTGGAGTNVTAATKVTGDLKVYAKWTANVYNISYTLNSGTNHSSNPSKYTYGVGVSSFYNPTRSCYTFGGWFSNSGLTTSKTSISKTETGDKTLYAKWTQNSCSISYNANGGSGAPGAQTKYCGTNLTLSSTKPTRSCYTFAGWNTNSSGTGTNYSAGGSYTSNSCVTLYAKWTQNSCSISYNANGGSGAPGAQTKYCGTNLTLSSTKPTRANYTFAGWNTNSSGTGTNYSAGGSYTSNSCVTLYAKWTAVAPTCGTTSVTGSGTTRTISVGCKNPDGTACSTVTGTVTTNGTHSLTIKGSNGATKSCSITVSGIVNKPTVTWYGNSSGCSVTCPSGSYYSAFNIKWGYNISGPTLTSSSYQYTYYNYNGNNAGLEYTRYLDGTVKLGTAYNWGCGNTTQTEMWFSRSHCGGSGATTNYTYIQANACSSAGCTVQTKKASTVSACGC